MALAQTKYRFGVNEGNEATHGWLAAENTGISLAPDVIFLLRGNIQNLDGLSAFGPPCIIQPYYSYNAGVKTLVSAGAAEVISVASVLTEDGDCTQRLTGTGAFTANNDGQTEAGAAAGIGSMVINADGCTEAEFSLQVVAAGVAHGDTLDFYFYVNGVQTTATVTPRLTVSLSTEAAFDTLDSKVSGRADGPWFTSSR